MKKIYFPKAVKIFFLFVLNKKIFFNGYLFYSTYFFVREEILVEECGTISTLLQINFTLF